MSWAGRLVSLWTALYTAGLTSEVRDERRAEIASDLWEHGECAGARGRRSAHVDASIAWRCIRGMAADVTWRRRQRYNRLFVLRSCSCLGWIAAACACFLLMFVPAGISVGYLISPGMREDPQWVPFTVIASAIFVTEVIGLGLVMRRRRAGLLILGAGIWSLVGVMFWAWPVVVPAGVVATVGMWRIAVRARSAAVARPRPRAIR